jgi:hypothetical protein
MKVRYHFIRFSDNVPVNIFGDTPPANLFIMPLIQLCGDCGGHYIDGNPFFHNQSHQKIEEVCSFLVGTCLVKIHVNLPKGEKYVGIGYLEGFEDKDLIEMLKKLFGEKNMFSSVAEYDRKENT